MSKDYMTDGRASWITYANPQGSVFVEDKNPWEFHLTIEDQLAPITDVRGVAIFRKVFTARDVKNARIDATALGVFDLWCNGQRVGRQTSNGDVEFDELKPGWTEYRKRVLYYSYDITSYIREGENVLLAAVAPGWYNGRIALGTYGKTHVSFLGALHLLDAGGDRTIYTDDSWDACWGGRIRAADIWDGELCDGREMSYAEMSLVNTRDIDWDVPTEESYDIFVTPHIGPTVKARAGLSRKPVSINVYNGTVDNGSDHGRINVVRTVEGGDVFSLKKGERAIIDFGQNLVGYPVFTVKGTMGTQVTARVSEMLNDSGDKARLNDGPEGSLYTANYRSAKAKVSYITRGDAGGEAYRPTFTYLGFRYCELLATDDVEISDLTAAVVGSDTRETGRIETSHKDVNRLISNILWGQRGNYLSVPTDCPQRDERLGWMFDTHAFAGTAAYNADVRGFFHKWLQDMRDSQAENGMYPDVVPAVRVIGFGGAAWSDAGIIVPHVMWKMYGDNALVEAHYESMERYMDWLATTDLMGAAPTYGDWLGCEYTDPRLVGVAYYAHDARCMEAMSRAIGREDRAAHYREVYENVRDKFRSLYCDENGDLIESARSQTCYLLALYVDLLDEDSSVRATAALRQKILDNGCKLSTGFVGTYILNNVLAEHGENDLAYSLLLQPEFPSWLYSVHQGATTMWEEWNSYTHEKGFYGHGMSSFNHYAFGAVEEWMYRHMAGIESSEDAPGFAHPILQPKPDVRRPEDIPEGQERITWVKASYDSCVGTIVSNWDMTDGFVYETTVPLMSTLYLPVLTDAETFVANGCTCRFGDYERVGNTVKLTLEAGTYIFKE